MSLSILIPRLMTFRLFALLIVAFGTVALNADRTSAAGIPDLTKTVEFEREAEYHLGPTGLKGWMYVAGNFMTADARQILITAVADGSPADGILQVGDVILGVNGKHFDSDARKAFGSAIDNAERTENNGILKIVRWRPNSGVGPRQGTETTAELKLKVMGNYSDTAPYDCPKSKRILDDALKILLERNDMGRFGSNALALLATGEKEHIKIVRDYIHKSKFASPDITFSVESGGKLAWTCGYHNLLLTEYYLATGDDYVLPAIKEYAIKTAMGQSNGGTWGHGFAWTSQNDGKLHGRLPGYGSLNQAGLPCLLSLILAKKCGVEHPEIDDAISRASRFFFQFVDKGSIGYGYHRPSLEIYANGRNGMSGNGKNGIAAITFRTLGNQEATRFFSKLTTSLYNTCEYGHSGNSYSYFWDPLGANCGGPKSAAAFLGKLRWYFALSRQADGSFVYQQLGGQYGSGMLDATASQVLIAAMPRKALYITGKNSVQPNWLNEKEAKEAIAAGKWRLANTTDMSVEELMGELHNWSPIAREWIAKGLGKKDGEFIPQLIKMLDSEDPNARAGACAALGYVGPRAATAVPELSKLLTDESSPVAMSASYALARIGKPSQKALPEMLRAVLASKEKELMRPQQQALAFSLGYKSGRYAPLYFDGVLPQIGRDANPLDDFDRDLLYPAISKLLEDSAGRTRGGGAYAFNFFNREDVGAMAQEIYDAIKYPALNYTMFDDVPRARGLDLMARFHIAEGIPLCFETFDLDRWGSVMRVPNRLRTLQAYGGSAKPYLPQIRDLRLKWPTGEFRELIEKTIHIIETDTEDQPLVSLHTFVGERLEKELASAKDAKSKADLCRSLIEDNPTDYLYQAACLTKLTALLGPSALGDLLPVIGAENEIVRSVAVELAAELPLKNATDKWRALLSTANGSQLAGVIDILGQRRDPATLSDIAKFIGHKEEAVRISAIRAVGLFGDKTTIPLLMKALATEPSDRQRAAIETALIETCRNAGKIDHAFVSSLTMKHGDVPATTRATLVSVIGHNPSQAATALLIASVEDKEQIVSRAVFRSLATSNDPQATNVLLGFLKTHDRSRAKHGVVVACLQRIATGRVPAKQRLHLLEQLMELDDYNRNSQIALSELQWLPSTDALRLAHACLQKERLSQAASAAAVAIARRLSKRDAAQRKIAIEVLKDVIATTKDEETLHAAKAIIK